MIRISIRQLIDANKRALDERKLGAFRAAQMEPPAQHRHLCLYRYPDGCGCAIGVALPEEVISQIVGNHLNSASLGKLTWESPDLNTPVEYEDRKIFEITQLLHDGWLRGTESWSNHALPLARLLGPVYGAFMDVHSRAFPILNEEAFRAWIDFLDAMHPEPKT